MDSNDISLSIDELAERTQTPVRTVRYYIAENLLPGPGARGKGAVYTEEHLLRLRLIRRLTERRAPLAEIRALLAGVTGEDIRALLAEEDARAEALERATQSLSPKDYVSALLERARTPQTPAKPPTPKPLREAFQSALTAQTPQAPMGRPLAASSSTPAPAAEASAWRRVELAPGVELHIRADAEARERALIERVLRAGTEERKRDDESDD